MRVLAALIAILSIGCPSDEPPGWVRFNTDDVVEVLVGPDADPTPAEIQLWSTTGELQVGTATVDPGGAPVGTDVVVRVVVDDDYEGDVGIVTLRTDAGDRGVRVHELLQDSADRGLWRVTVVPMGAEDEVRTDLFEIQLWTEAEEGDPSAIEDPVGGDEGA